MENVNKEICNLHTQHFEKIITQHEETIKQLTECTQKLTLIISEQEKKQKDLDGRVKSIERKPSVLFEKILVAGITALISVAVTMLLTGR